MNSLMQCSSPQTTLHGKSWSPGEGGGGDWRVPEAGTRALGADQLVIVNFGSVISKWYPKSDSSPKPMDCKKMTSFCNALMTFLVAVKKWLHAWWGALALTFLLLILWGIDIVTLVHAHYASPSGHGWELLVAGVVLSVPLILLSVTAFPDAVQTLLSYWLVYLVTWGDDHAHHALSVFYEVHIRRPAAAMDDAFLLKYGVTPFSYWAVQGVVLACLATMVCGRLSRRRDEHERVDDEDEEVVTHVTAEAGWVEGAFLQMEGLPSLPGWLPFDPNQVSSPPRGHTLVTVTYTAEVEAQVARPIR